MAFPAGAVLLDDFNRANGGLSGSGIWSNEGVNTGTNGLAIFGEQMGVESNSLNGREAAKAGPDCFRYIDLKTLMGAAEGYVFFSARATTGGTWNGYGFIFIRTGASTFVHQIRRYASGSSTVLGGTASTKALTAGDKIGWSIEGKVLKLWRLPTGSETWEELASREDATYSTDGFCGIEMTTTTRLDNLMGATILAPSPGLALPIIS